MVITLAEDERGGQRPYRNRGRTVRFQLCRHISHRFASGPETVGAARELLGQQLKGWELTDPGGAAELLVSELVTNAVVHVASALELIIAVADGTLEVGVADSDPHWPGPQRPKGTAPNSGGAPLEWLGESGRGLRLVDALADEWGVEQRRSGKQVWFRLALQEDWPYRSSCLCGGTRLDSVVRLGSGAAVVPTAPPWARG